jgi:hypothetical protein
MHQLYAPLEPFSQFGRDGQAGLSVPAGIGLIGSDSGWAGSPTALRRTADGIRTTALSPGYLNATSALTGGAQFMFGGIPGFSQIGQMLQQLIGMLQQAFGNQSPPENQYTDATASSTGDPHLAFDGTQSNGTASSQHFDSMVSHNDLIDSDSIPGGYQIATQVTQPNANGITLNKSATITSNYGQSQISVDNAGNASITLGGEPLAISSGQTLDLGNGQTVTKNADNSLTVINTNGQGGTINTTLKPNGGGVDVTTRAHNADLGGDIVTGPTPQPNPALQIDAPLQTPHFTHPFERHHPHPQTWY